MINPAIENDLKNMSLNDVNYADYIKENYIQIPDNATNGDAIKTMYGIEPMYGDEHFIFYGGEMRFSREWWNSPYKVDKEGD